jgi:hypothetical protein
MRFFRLLAAVMFAAVGSIALASCKKPDAAAAAGGPGSEAVAALERVMEELRTKPFTVANSTESDIDGFIRALPQGVTVTFAQKSFDAASGATTLTNVVIKTSAFPEGALNIGELKVWGLNTQLAAARLSGQRLAEAGPLARRIDAKNVSVTGLGEIMGGLVTGMMQEAASAMPGADAPTPEIGRYDFRIARIIMDNVSLRPFNLAAAPEAGARVKGGMSNTDDLMAVGFHGLQTYAAWTNAFAADTAVYDGIEAEAQVAESGSTSTVKFGMASMGARGMNGGDLAYAIVKGTTVDMTMTNPLLGGGPMHVTGGVELYTYENIRLARALDYLARGVMPPRTEADLLSLGVYRNYNTHYEMGGKEIYTVREGVFDGSGWRWLIPTHIRGEMKDAAFNVTNFAAAINEMQRAATPAGETPPGDILPSEVLDILKRHGMDRPVFNVAAGWDWNADTGVAVIDMNIAANSFDTVAFRLEGASPTFSDISSRIPETGEMTDAQKNAIAELFTGKTLLRSLSLDVTDQGGVDRIFGAAADFINLDTVREPTASTQRETAESLRNQTVNQINSEASNIKDAQPAQAAILAAAARFLSSREPFRIALNPQPPLTANDNAETFLNDPEGQAARLGLTVNGQKPPAPQR